MEEPRKLPYIVLDYKSVQPDEQIKISMMIVHSHSRGIGGLTDTFEQ